MKLGLICTQIYSQSIWPAVGTCSLASGYSLAHNIGRACGKRTNGGSVLPPFFSHHYQLCPTQVRGLRHMCTFVHSGPEAQAPLLQEACLWPYGLGVHMSEMRSTDEGRGPFRPWKQAQFIGSGTSRVPGTQTWSRRENGGSSLVYPLGLQNKWEE